MRDQFDRFAEAGVGFFVHGRRAWANVPDAVLDDFREWAWGDPAAVCACRPLGGHRSEVAAPDAWVPALREWLDEQGKLNGPRYWLEARPT